jgi:hypothetical protein
MMRRRLPRWSAVIAVVTIAAALPSTTLGHGPDPAISSSAWTPNQALPWTWASTQVPPAWLQAAFERATADSNASRSSRAGIFVRQSGTSNTVAYGEPTGCSPAGIACFSRNVPYSYRIWFRAHGFRFDWGTLRWCQGPSGYVNGCFDVENIALDELGHVEGLGHHLNYGDERDYRDAVVQTASRVKPQSGWDAHVYGRLLYLPLDSDDHIDLAFGNLGPGGHGRRDHGDAADGFELGVRCAVQRSRQRAEHPHRAARSRRVDLGHGDHDGPDGHGSVQRDGRDHGLVRMARDLPEADRRRPRHVVLWLGGHLHGPLHHLPSRAGAVRAMSRCLVLVASMVVLIGGCAGAPPLATPDGTESAPPVLPAAVLAAPGVEAPGTVGSWTLDGSGSDSPWLSAAGLREIDIGRGPVTVRLDGGRPIGSWLARAAPAADRTGETAVELGGRDDGQPALDHVDLEQLPPAGGPWVIAMRLDRADGRGDATFYWLIIVG